MSLAFIMGAGVKYTQGVTQSSFGVMEHSLDNHRDLQISIKTI